MNLFRQFVTTVRESVLSTDVLLLVETSEDTQTNSSHCSPEDISVSASPSVVDACEGTEAESFNSSTGSRPL